MLYAHQREFLQIHIRNLYYTKKKSSLGVLSISLPLSQPWQCVVSCDNLATNTIKWWGESECDIYLLGGKSVLHITFQAEGSSEVNGFFFFLSSGGKRVRRFWFDRVFEVLFCSFKNFPSGTVGSKLMCFFHNSHKCFIYLFICLFN